MQRSQGSLAKYGEFTPLLSYPRLLHSSARKLSVMRADPHGPQGVPIWDISARVGVTIRTWWRAELPGRPRTMVPFLILILLRDRRWISRRTPSSFSLLFVLVEYHVNKTHKAESSERLDGVQKVSYRLRMYLIYLSQISKSELRRRVLMQGFHA